MKEYKYKINGTEYNVSILSIDDAEAQLEVNGTPYTVELSKKKKTTIPKISRPTSPAPSSSSAATATNIQKDNAKSSGTGFPIKAPLPGVILSVTVKEGDTVTKGQKVAVLEAMKMENAIESDRDGKILKINVKEGDSILEGTDIVIIG